MKDQRRFSLFDSHLDLAPIHWKKGLERGGWAIDATCGNGQDALQLSKLIAPESGLIGLDIQPLALANTEQLLLENGQNLEQIHLFCQNHAKFPTLAYEQPIQLIVYNLGYLPRGDKSITTLVDSTLTSIRAALELLLYGGTISITCYPGHPEGALEEKALLEFAETLHPKLWSVSFHSWRNRQRSPSLLILQKNKPLH